MRRSNAVSVGRHTIGEGHPVLVIAEAGVNHDGKGEQADRLIEAAQVAGADAVKFQIFRARALVLRGAPQATYQSERDPAKDQLEMLERLELPPEEFHLLSRAAADRGIQFLASPFDERSLRVLVDCGAPAVKLGSGEITNFGLIEAAARTGLPLLLSTGMSDLSEVRAAVRCFERSGGNGLVLLHCVSAYPAPSDQMNLRAIRTLLEEFPFPVGLSDHTQGLACAVAAVALGAKVIEKHLTLDRMLPGPDHWASAEPDEFREMVEAVHTVEGALGDGAKKPQPCEEEIRGLARRSLVARHGLHANQPIATEDLEALRPGSGISPARRDEFVGKRPRADIEAGTLLAEDMFF